MPPTVWTIGYEAVTFATFLEALRPAGIGMVIDVRDLPLSRRAGFSKTILRASLNEAGIGYTHLKGLGTPKEGRQAIRRGDTATFWSIYEARLLGTEGQRDLAVAAGIAGEQASALLCFEADPHLCHRSRVAESLEREYGFCVNHLRPTQF
jgi:uncharacterized protein (DUF488 family)